MARCFAVYLLPPALRVRDLAGGHIWEIPHTRFAFRRGCPSRRSCPHGWPASPGSSGARPHPHHPSGARQPGCGSKPVQGLIVFPVFAFWFGILAALFLDVVFAWFDDPHIFKIVFGICSDRVIYVSLDITIPGWSLWANHAAASRRPCPWANHRLSSTTCKHCPWHAPIRPS